MSNIIVTGAFGTLGQAVIAELGARGYELPRSTSRLRLTMSLMKWRWAAST